MDINYLKSLGVISQDSIIFFATYVPNKEDGVIVNYTPMVNVYDASNAVLVKKVYFQKEQNHSENALIISRRMAKELSESKSEIASIKEMILSKKSTLDKNDPIPL